MLCVVAVAMLALVVPASAGSQGVSAALPTVTSLSPDWGPMTGGTVVTVTGTGFVVGAKATCLFDGLIYAFNGIAVPATVKSATVLECTAPGILLESPTYLEVSMGGGYSSSERQFNYIQLFSAAAGRLPYTDETAGHVLVQVAPQVLELARVGKSESGTCRVTATLATGQLLVAGVVPADGAPHRLAFDLGSVPLGFNMTARASLVVMSSGSRSAPSSSGAQAATRWEFAPQVMTVNRTFQMYKLAPKTVTVAVDRWTLGLVVGRAPFLAMGYFDTLFQNSKDVDLRVMNDLTNMGFQHMITYGTNLFVDPDNPSLINKLKDNLDAAAWIGLHKQISLAYWTKLILDSPLPMENCTAELAAINLTVSTFKDHPGVLGWYLTDDTLPYPFEKVGQLYKYVKKLDPYHPIFNTFSGSGQAWSYQVPYVGYDVPQYEMYDFSDPSYQTATISTAYPLNFVPAFICGQAAGGQYGTRNTVRAQAYVSFMFHANSMVLWEYWVWRIPTWFKHLMYEFSVLAAEFGDLIPSIFSEDKNPPAVAISSPEGTWVAAKSWREASGCINIAVANLHIQPTTFTLSSPAFQTAVNNSVWVMWEARNTTLQQGNVSEPIGSYGRHVYRVNCSGAMSHWGVGEARALPPGVHLLPDGSAPVNLVINPSFEDSTMPGVPDVTEHHQSRWSFNPVDGYGVVNPTYFTDATTAVHGRNSLRLVNSLASATIPTDLVIAMNGLQPGDTISVSVWFRPPAIKPLDVVTASITAGSYVASPDPLETKDYGEADSWKWSQHTWKGILPSGLTTLSFTVVGTGVCWVDYIEVYVIEAAAQAAGSARQIAV